VRLQIKSLRQQRLKHMHLLELALVPGKRCQSLICNGVALCQHVEGGLLQIEGKAINSNHPLVNNIIGPNEKGFEVPTNSIEVAGTERLKTPVRCATVFIWSGLPD